MSAGAVQNFQTFVDALMCKYRNSENLELDPDIFIPKQAPGKAGKFNVIKENDCT